MICRINFVLILILWFFDVQYYLRIVFAIALAKVLRRRNITDELTTYGLSFTQDSDVILKHMYNWRYVRELDFARFNFTVRTGLFDVMLKHKTDGPVGATSIRYRRAIPPFTFYKITTKMIYWDDHSLYFEHRFVTMDGFVRTTVLQRVAAFKAVVDEMTRVLGAGHKPQPTLELDFWMKSMDASRTTL